MTSVEGMKTMSANLSQRWAKTSPANLSLLQTFTLNILRRNGYSSITSVQRFTSNDIDKLLSFVG
ncbi:MAG: hypothetical protein HWQ38_31355 [Nostoc sp. NMS7]|uniref:hypothetical protein n=1 Tax=Nostoc sp. NMS7 TaxID=2815391 RepID=UPI0025F2895A|nr:hypothetical protein [Nostoc sp. NMS7]MBN3950725.1 hypothetical protein [Nostoc sp. NMS7]